MGCGGWGRGSGRGVCWGEMRIVERKKSALDGDREEELGAGWEKRGGDQEGVFYFFLLMVGRGKNIKILIPSQHKSMFAPSQHHGGGWARQI